MPSVSPRMRARPARSSRIKGSIRHHSRSAGSARASRRSELRARPDAAPRRPCVARAPRGALRGSATRSRASALRLLDASARQRQTPFAIAHPCPAERLVSVDRACSTRRRRRWRRCAARAFEKPVALVPAQPEAARDATRQQGVDRRCGRSRNARPSAAPRRRTAGLGPHRPGSSRSRCGRRRVDAMSDLQPGPAQMRRQPFRELQPFTRPAQHAVHGGPDREALDVGPPAEHLDVHAGVAPADLGSLVEDPDRSRGSGLPRKGAPQRPACEKLEGRSPSASASVTRAWRARSWPATCVVARLEPAIRRFDQASARRSAACGRARSPAGRRPGLGRLGAQAIERVDQLGVHFEEQPRTLGGVRERARAMSRACVQWRRDAVRSVTRTQRAARTCQVAARSASPASVQ